MYGVPESISTDIPQRINHDRQTSCSILESLGDVIPINTKIIRLGKIHDDNSAHSLKILFDNKETASNLLRQFHSTKRAGSSLMEGFRIVSDKTVLQRKRTTTFAPCGT